MIILQDETQSVILYMTMLLSYLFFMEKKIRKVQKEALCKLQFCETQTFILKFLEVKQVACKFQISILF